MLLYHDSNSDQYLQLLFLYVVVIISKVWELCSGVVDGQVKGNVKRFTKASQIILIDNTSILLLYVNKWNNQYSASQDMRSVKKKSGTS